MVKVRITAKQLGAFNNEVLMGDMVVKKLRAAGIPVIGALWPRGVQGGLPLAMVCENGGDLLFTWDGTPPAEEELW